MIKQIDENIDLFRNIVSKANSITDIIKKYNIPGNGRYRKDIRQYIEKYRIDISHFGKLNNNRKYDIIEKICPICQSLFTTQQHHPRETTTCSYKCSNLYFRKIRTDDIKRKISNSLKQYHNKNKSPYTLSKKYLYTCDCCKLKFRTKNKLAKYCSFLCRNKCPEYRKKLSECVKLRIENGTHSGWSSRKLISYPEKFFMNVLNNNNISYQHNKMVGKYFIDFAISDKMIALEIDGKQHQLPDRKQSDEIKDIYLKNVGWIVYRIPWKSINNEDGKKYISIEIENFIQFYNSQKNNTGSTLPIGGPI